MVNPFLEVLLHALTQMLVRKLDNDLELEETWRFSDQTLKKFETWLVLLWKLFACLGLIFILFYWAIALVHSRSAYDVTSNDNVACITAD